VGKRKQTRQILVGYLIASIQDFGLGREEALEYVVRSLTNKQIRVLIGRLEKGGSK
jgi:hypothetical protein